MSDPTGGPAIYPATGDYAAEEQARFEAGQPPQPVPVYPVSPAGQLAREALALGQSYMTAPTLPQIDPSWKRAPAQRLNAPDPADPVYLLQVYPQTINSEYLPGMAAAINTFLDDRNVQALVDYAYNINPAYAVELGRRAKAVIEAAGQLPASITSHATADNSPADGSVPCAVIFTVMDSFGMAVAHYTVQLAIDSATAQLAATTAVTNDTGEAGAVLTDTTPEQVKVTATAGNATGTHVVSFVEVPT